MFKSVFLIISIIFFTCSIEKTKCEELTEENWRELLEGNEWMIEFYAPWCPACNRLQPIWNQFTAKAKELNIRVGAVDLTKYPSLSGLFSVTSLPTIYHVKDKQYRVYEGNRDLDELVNFIKEEKWKDLTPVNPYLSPDSLIMKIVSYLFKVTLYFKDLYTTLNETYGMPNWLVLTIFVIATIALGLLLGIILIICIDYICWPRKFEPSKELKEDLQKTGDDLVDEQNDDNAAVNDDDEKIVKNKKDKANKKRNSDESEEGGDNNKADENNVLKPKSNVVKRKTNVRKD